MGDFGFEFPKRSQLLIRAHNETLSFAAMRVSTQFALEESTAENPPQPRTFFP